MRILVVAPHPDDEVLGCGGTLLKKSSEGHIIGWLLVTTITDESGWSLEAISSRDKEIEHVRQDLKILPENLFKLGFPTSQLDEIPLGRLISSMSQVFKKFQPDEVFLPHPSDIHTDHRISFEAASACTKWFRYPSVKRVMAYETLSETDFSINPSIDTFRPNVFVDISNHLSGKIDLLKIYQSELGAHPFPRNLDAVRSQAILRGTQSGTQASEAFQLLRSFE